MTIADFNGDGKQDTLAIHDINVADGSMSLSLGNGDGTFGAASKIIVTGNAGARFFSIASGDLNNDSNQDIILVDRSNSRTLVLLGNGNGTFQSPVTYNYGSRGQVRMLDFDGDGNLDFIEKDGATTRVFKGKGDGALNAPANYAGDNSTLRGLAIGDFNGDGKYDFATAGSVALASHVYLQDVSTTVGTSSTTVSALSDMLLDSQSSAQDLLDIIDTGITNLNTARSAIGAIQNRFEFAANNNASMIENLSQARSNILDADMAYETSELVRQQILQQAQVAVLGQANVQLQLVLNLLKF